MHGLIFETSICYWQDQPGISCMFFFCVFTQTTRFFFFLSFQKKKDHSTVYEPKVNRIHSTGLSIKTFVCPVIRTLGSTVCVRRSLYWAQRFFYFCLPPPTRQKKTHPASPRTTHSHTHHSTAQRSHEAEFSAKTSEEEKTQTTARPDAGNRNVADSPHCT